MKIPCDGCQTRSVDPKRDWIYLSFGVKVTVCEECADNRFDDLYDKISFDWWELDLKRRFEVIKRDQIKRLGSMSPTFLIEERERIAASMKRKHA